MSAREVLYPPNPISFDVSRERASSRRIVNILGVIGLAQEAINCMEGCFPACWWPDTGGQAFTPTHASLTRMAAVETDSSHVYRTGAGQQPRVSFEGEFVRSPLTLFLAVLEYASMDTVKAPIVVAVSLLGALWMATLLWRRRHKTNAWW